jgi:hypothetical protein
MQPLTPRRVASALSLLFLILAYSSVHRFGYISAPGGDLYNHFTHIRELVEQGLPAFFSGYPKLFHLIVMIGIGLTGMDALRVMLYLYPLLIIGAGWSAYALLRSLKGEWAGVMALFGTLFVANQPLQTLYDGGFPNYMSVAIWLPLVLLGVTYLDKTRLAEQAKGAALISGAGLLILITHHFSAFYLLVLAAGAALLNRKRYGRYFVWLVVAILLILATPFGSGARNILAGVLIFDGSFPFLHIVGKLDNPNALIPFWGFPDYFTPVIFWFGLSVVGLIIYAWRLGKRLPQAVSLLAILSLTLMLASQVALFGFPLRLARDAGVPLLLLACYGIATLVDWFHRRGYRAAGIALGIILALGLWRPVTQHVGRFMVFEPTMQYTPAQEDLLQQVPADDPIVAIDQLLPAVVHRNVRPLMVEGDAARLLQSDLQRARFALVTAKRGPLAGEVFARYEAALEKAGYVLYLEKEDPLHVSRMYAR